MEKINKKWVALRQIGIDWKFLPDVVFDDRKQAIKWLKGLLKQTLKDFDKQDKTDEFNYPPEIRGLKIIPIENRKEYLGL